MITLLHISIAIGSIVYLAVLLFRSTRMSFLPAYLLIAGTFVTGVLLMILQPSATAHVCVSGSIYLFVMGGMIAMEKRRLFTQRT